MHNIKVQQLFYRVLNILNSRIAKLSHLLTLHTDQVIVLTAAVRSFILGQILSELMLAYQITLNQQIERVIHRGTTHPVIFVFHVDVQRLNIKMAIQRINFFEYGVPFWRLAKLLIFKISSKDFLYLVKLLQIQRHIHCKYKPVSISMYGIFVYAPEGSWTGSFFACAILCRPKCLFQGILAHRRNMNVFSITKHRTVGILMLLFGSTMAFAQPAPLRELALPGKVKSITVDRAGDFYLVLGEGSIQKIDKEGATIATAKIDSAITAFDPTNAAQLLVWSKSARAFTWLSPSLEISGFVELDPAWAIEPELICPGGHKWLWIFDAADSSLKKIDLRSGATDIEFSIAKALDQGNPIAMKEYLNFMFLLDDKHRLSIFNQFGRLLKQIDFKGNAIRFLGEELYDVQGDSITFFNLYTSETRYKALPKTALDAVLTDERLLLQESDTGVILYPWAP